MTPIHRALLAFALLAALFLAVPGGVRAQEAPRYWIFLEDKPEAETAVVTDRARRRRALRGRGRDEQLDRVVASSYLDGLRRLGVHTVVESRWLNAVSAQLTPDQAARVGGLPYVRDVRSVGRLTRRPPAPAILPAEPAKMGGTEYGPSQMQLALMNATATIEEGINGAGVRLGFLDTSFGAFEHPAFARLKAEGRLIEVRDFVGLPQPGASHGLSVASAAVGYEPGQLLGPAFGAEVLAAVTEYVPSETNAEEDFFVAGLEWMEAMGVDVVNVSLGYTTFDEGERSYAPGDLDGRTAVTTVAADRAVSLGVVVVASAGNEACSSPDGCWYYVGTPADGDHVITVGAVTADSARSFFSSRGPTADGRIKPDVAAMGSGVYVAAPGGYVYANGTSFSSPLVAAVVCQMLQANPELTPDRVRALLRATASRSTSPNNELGWGIIDAAAAVDAAVHEGTGGGGDFEISARPYPNPATDEVFIHINADVSARVTVDVLDLLGRRIEDSAVGYLTPGETILRLPTQRLASGVYLFLLTTGGRRASGAFVIAR